ncbi:MAG: bifunctional lysylphosphatidylglycerol flippase/synthetase MprF [Eubacteriales bacterium]
MISFLRRLIQNTAVLLLMLIGIKNLFAALPLNFCRRYNYYYGRIIGPGNILLNHAFSFSLGVLMLLLAYSLYKRMRRAWYIEVSALTATLFFHLFKRHIFSFQFILIESFVLIVLLVSYKDFCRHNDKITLKKALIFIGVSLVMVIINAAAGLYFLKMNFRDSLRILIFMDTGIMRNNTGIRYAESLILINWIFIISSAVLLLQPLVCSPIADVKDIEKVRRLVMSFGQNPIAYLAVEHDKKYFFGSDVNGVCAYRIIKNVFVVCGDIICGKTDGFLFLNEILSFCRQNGYHILLLNITNNFIDLYKMAGFGIIKYGEDACFKLGEYSLSGGKAAKVRTAINQAKNAGITVHEYKPTENKNPDIEKEFADISKEWHINKGGINLGFMLGGTGLSNPLDRRYFYASDKDGIILGFAVFLPYLCSKGYMADVTRRRTNAPQGVLEIIIYNAFMKMKDEGVLWGNMGLSPLYNVAEGDCVAFTEKLFSYIYENMNNSYGFKSLHHSKKKYAPTEWQPRYLAYSPKPFSIIYGYAILKVQIKNKITKTILNSIVKEDAGLGVLKKLNFHKKKKR